APGRAGLLGLLLAAGAALTGGLAFWVAVPQLMVALVPALIPSPMVLLVFAWEGALGMLALAMVAHGLRHRAAWPWRLAPAERWMLPFAAWGLFTAFWSPDVRFYLLGARRMLVAVCALWVASRLPRVASRRWFDLGLLVGAGALAWSAIHRALTTGFTAEHALIHRSQVTTLGWGTANYVATLLLLFAPSVLRLLLRGRSLERVLAAVAFALVTVVQLIVASRAATVLFLLGTLVQLVRATRRH